MSTTVTPEDLAAALGAQRQAQSPIATTHDLTEGVHRVWWAEIHVGPCGVQPWVDRFSEVLGPYRVTRGTSSVLLNSLVADDANDVRTFLGWMLGNDLWLRDCDVWRQRREWPLVTSDLPPWRERQRHTDPPPSLDVHFDWMHDV